MLKKPPEIGGLTHKIRKIVFSYFRCPVFAFSVSRFNGDYDEIEIRQEWQEENTLHEWDEGEFQLEPPLDTEEGRTAADEWDER